MSRTFKILIAVLVSLVGLGLIYLGFSYYYLSNIKPVSEQTPLAEKLSPTPLPSSTLAVSPIASPKGVSKLTDPGVEWITPEKLADLKLFKSDPKNPFECSVSENQIANYYKVAKLQNGGEIILAESFCGIGGTLGRSAGGTAFFRFRKDKNGEYFYLKKHSFEENEDVISRFLVEKAHIDRETLYNSLVTPELISTDTGVTLARTDTLDFFSNFKGTKKIAESSYGDIYEAYESNEWVEKINNTSVKNRLLILKKPDSTASVYSLKIPFMSDDAKPQFTFLNGRQNQDIYFSTVIYSSCGSFGDGVVQEQSLIQGKLEKFAKTTTGEDLYRLTDKNSPILKLAYESYKVGREKEAMPFSEFVSKNPVLLWEDPFGRYITFFNSDYAPAAECGKPVIYLYPEKPTVVRVKVNVQVKKSDPLYQEGWQVLALPTGQLILGGKVYPYLYWEGVGKEYPQVKSGFVVERSKVRETLVEHLSKLGLNQKEIGDFLEFWLPRMPNTPYVRLTWFGTKEMERLAPLSVEPKPNTIIRVFLDFEGLYEYKSLPPQRLLAPQRKGFTLVEWGGLLIGE